MITFLFTSHAKLKHVRLVRSSDQINLKVTIDCGEQDICWGTDGVRAEWKLDCSCRLRLFDDGLIIFPIWSGWDSPIRDISWQSGLEFWSVCSQLSPFYTISSQFIAKRFWTPLPERVRSTNYSRKSVNRMHLSPSFVQFVLFRNNAQLLGTRTQIIPHCESIQNTDRILIVTLRSIGIVQCYAPTGITVIEKDAFHKQHSTRSVVFWLNCCEHLIRWAMSRSAADVVERKQCCRLHSFAYPYCMCWQGNGALAHLNEIRAIIPIWMSSSNIKTILLRKRHRHSKRVFICLRRLKRTWQDQSEKRNSESCFN